MSFLTLDWGIVRQENSAERLSEEQFLAKEVQHPQRLGSRDERTLIEKRNKL